MWRRLTGLDLFAAGSAAAVTLFFAGLTMDVVDYFAGPGGLGAQTLVMGGAGWLLATYGPMAAAVAGTRLSNRASTPWLIHATVVLGMLAAFKVGSSIVLYALDQPDFDFMMGAPINPAFVLLVMAVAGYAVASARRQPV